MGVYDFLREYKVFVLSYLFLGQQIEKAKVCLCLCDLSGVYLVQQIPHLVVVDEGFEAVAGKIKVLARIVFLQGLLRGAALLMAY